MKKILLLGSFGKTGIAVIKYFLRQGYYIRALDQKKEIPSELKNLKNIEFHSNQEDLELLNDIEFVVISPGVPSNINIVNKAKKGNIPIFSEIELAFRKFPFNWVGITGTDGKSTTTSLTYEILKESYKNVILGGNIGNPLIDKVDNISNDSIIVAELSSFQLENIENFKPKVAALLNIAADHLDRYNDMNEYIDAKFNIFKNQTESDYAIFNIRNGLYKDRIEKVKAEKYFFCLDGIEGYPNGSFIKDGKFIFRRDSKEEEVCAVSELKLYGEHNKENALVAITIAKILNVDNNIIKKVLNNFRGLPHRMELVLEINKRKFINDSKATTVSAVMMSIRSIEGKGIIIMGGRDKGLDFSILRDLILEKVRYLILIGEAKDKIKRMLNLDNNFVIECDNLEEAVFKSYDLSKEGDTILLSPGCTSYDMFKNFEERGEAFKKAVFKLNSLQEKN